MNLQTAVKTCFQKYVTFSGRASRSEFWFFYLFNFVTALVLGLLGGMLLGDLGSLLMVAFYLATFLPSLAVSIRRLHDINKSGWWILIALVPLVGVLALIYFYVKKGTEGSNDFGAPAA